MSKKSIESKLSGVSGLTVKEVRDILEQDPYIFGEISEEALALALQHGNSERSASQPKSRPSKGAQPKPRSKSQLKERA